MYLDLAECLTLLVIRYTYEVVETVEVGIPQAN